MKLGPMFKHFGSKFMAAKKYPAPIFNKISEQFAGGAGYSLNHWEKEVFLFEKDSHLVALWSWLINEATEDLIRKIPVGLPEGTDIREVNLPYGAKLLLKHWQRTNNVGNCWTVSSWGSKPGQWTVAEQLSCIKHWTILDKPMGYVSGVTHFINPPYIANYKYKQPTLDYNTLGKNILKGKGQIIVCEGASKEGDAPMWLPFEKHVSLVTSRRKKTNNHHCQEYIFTKTM